MKTNFLLIKATAAVSALPTTMTSNVIISTQTMTATVDPWQCIPANLTRYLDNPQPTGSLRDAFFHRGDDLRKTCTYTGTDINVCAPDKSGWCGISTVLPSTLTKDFSDYAGAASV